MHVDIATIAFSAAINRISELEEQRDELIKTLTNITGAGIAVFAGLPINNLGTAINESQEILDKHRKKEKK